MANPISTDQAQRRVINKLSVATGALNSISSPPTDAIVISPTANAAATNVVTITNASYGQASTLTIPDPGAASANILLSASSGGQTVSGNFTVSGYPLDTSITQSLVAHAGGGQSSATALPSATNVVATVATTGNSVALPVGIAGMCISVFNQGANSMQVFTPASGDASATINGTAGSTGIAQSAGTATLYYAITSAPGTVWLTK